LLIKYYLHLIYISLFAILILGVITGCNQKGQAAVEHKTSDAIVTPVEAVAVQRQDLAITRSYTGALEGSEQADIVPKISERIVAVNSKVGASVKKGDVLVVLDKGGPSSQYIQSEANFLNAEKNLTRMKALLKDGAISQQALDGTQTAYDIAKANYEAAKQSIELVAPISGVVTAFKARVGELSNPGIGLVTIAKLDEMMVIFNLNEDDLGDLSIGQEVSVFSDSRPDQTIKGKVSEFNKSADIQSRTFEVRALFRNTNEHWFKPGMFVKVKSSGKTQSQALVVPNQAIISDGTNNRVYLVHNGMAFLKTVTLGNSDGLKTAIREGLKEADSIVSVGWNNLRDSSKVTVVTARM